MFLTPHVNNINPLTAEDLTKILDQATKHAQLCENPILVSVEELQKSVDKVKEGEVQPQEPPQVIQTTGLSFIPPPLPLRLTMEAHQEPSGTVGEVTDISVQIVSTPPTTTTQEKDKEETQDKKESAIQTLVELPKIGTPTKTV